MPKVFNRAIQVGGEDLKIGTYIVNVAEFDADGNVTRAKGANVPADSDKGFAKGCRFIQTDGSNGTVEFINEGTASSADFNVVKTNGTADEVETVAATNAITAAESGKTYFLSHATEFVSTLSAPAAGLRYSFIVANAPETASYTIVTTGSANIILGQVFSGDLDAAGDTDKETSGGDTITFVDSKAVLGDRVDVISDGTNWFAYGFCVAFDAITITTAS
jgi:hypothetical protein